MIDRQLFSYRGHVYLCAPIEFGSDRHVGGIGLRVVGACVGGGLW